VWVNGKGERRVVIVGASAAGLRCACRLVRLCPTWSITVVEQHDRFSIAACGLPYVLSGDVGDLDALRRTSDGTVRNEAYFADVKGVTIRARARATAIDVVAQRLEVVGEDGEIEELQWDDLVLATGAAPRLLPGQPSHPRVHTVHTGDDVAAIYRQLAGGQIAHVAIIGAGLIGCELAEAFRALWGARVTMLEAAAAPLPGIVDDEIGGAVAGALRRNGVDLRCGSGVVAVTAAESSATVETTTGTVTADAVVVAIGVRPVVELAAAAGIALGPSGAIAVTADLATSVPGIWAAGDCVEVRHAVTGEPCHLPLGSLANRQGRALANTLAGRRDPFPPVAGAVAVKVFDYNVAAAGITRAAARNRGMLARSVWVLCHDRAGYMPEAKEIVVHLVYEQGTERILGVQVAGEGEACKRTDVAAQLIVRHATLADLAQLEHAYAPPYAPAVEPLAVAAWVAQNQEDGIIACSPLESMAGEAVLDVRHPEERAARPVIGATTTPAPLETLRGQGMALARGPWMAVCERGARSAEALRWLQAHGRYARYLGGGLRLRAIAGGDSR
jgi:NADPH-dependent 2,4-dienoyl-CoA reductase/sulfur reductase-like enzyme/rhodanese-related sulfurtransferase